MKCQKNLVTEIMAKHMLLRFWDFFIKNSGFYTDLYMTIKI